MLCPNCEVALDTACHSNNPPYSVNFLHEQFLVMDSADVGDGGDAGADDPGGECPSIPLNGEFIVPEPETRSAEDDDKIGLQTLLYERNDGVGRHVKYERHKFPSRSSSFASCWMFQWGYHDDGLDNAEFSQSDHT